MTKLASGLQTELQDTECPVRVSEHCFHGHPVFLWSDGLFNVQPTNDRLEGSWDKREVIKKQDELGIHSIMTNMTVFKSNV